jgi:hypothetical protein
LANGFRGRKYCWLLEACKKAAVGQSRDSAHCVADAAQCRCGALADNMVAQPCGRPIQAVWHAQQSQFALRQVDEQAMESLSVVAKKPLGPGCHELRRRQPAPVRDWRWSSPFCRAPLCFNMTAVPRAQRWRAGLRWGAPLPSCTANGRGS